MRKRVKLIECSIEKAIGLCIVFDSGNIDILFLCFVIRINK